MKRTTAISVLGLAAIVIAIALMANFGLLVNNTHSTQLSSNEMTISPQDQLQNFPQMLEEEFYLPQTETAAAQQESTAEAQQILDQIYPANPQCNIKNHKAGTTVAMGYGNGCM